jgi:hypothetical protein
MPETALASSRRSPSPQETINIVDHIFEHAALCRTSFASSSPSLFIGIAPSSTSGRYLAGELTGTLAL